MSYTVLTIENKKIKLPGNKKSEFYKGLKSLYRTPKIIIL